MKKMFVVLVLLIGGALLLQGGRISIAQDPLAPEGTPRETYFAPFPLTMALDGDLTDWQNVPTVTIPAGADLSSGNPAATFAAAADESYLYFMGDVIDNNIISGTHGADYWNEDSIEFYINASGDLTRTSYTDGVAQITVPAINATLTPEETIIAGVRGDTANAQIKVVYTDTGYAVEIAVPLKNDVWDIQPQHGLEIGLQVHLNGASTANRDTKLIWSVFDTGDQSYINPRLFGKLIFYEIGQTGIPDPVVVVAPTPTPLPEELRVPADAPYKNPALSVEERVVDLLARMTLDEKIGQMTLVEKGSIANDDITNMYIGGLLSGGGGFPTSNTPEGWLEMVNDFQSYALQTRLAIPLIYGVDAVHGHNNLHGATIFPHNIALGAAGDADLVERICHATALEVIATGIYWNYAPTIAVPQDIRWGRTYEGYGENTDLVTTLGVACVRGLQGENLGDPGSVLATPKHFIGDGGTAWGTSTTGAYMIDQGVTQVDEATLRALYLPPYQAAIENGAMSIMVSYSSWQDTKMHAQQYLITDVLKGELGFQGFVVSDWQAIDQISPNYYSAVVTAINAGIDMNMVPYNYIGFISTLQDAIEAGDISLERIDDAVRRILTVKFEMGLFDLPPVDESQAAVVGSDEHRALAREAVSKSLVLLQNNDNTLPLSKDTPTIFVAGSGSNNIGMQSGGWTIQWQGGSGGITIGTTIRQAIEAAVSENSTVYASAVGNFDEAIDADGNPLIADVGIVVIGETPYAEGVGDRDDLGLTITDRRLIDRIRERSEKLVVILLSGRPLIITDQLRVSDAFVAAWLPGTEGAGITDVLFGDVPFTGKLSYTWPRSMAQLPFDFANLPTEGCDAPLFPYGYGLDTSTQQVLTIEDCPAS